MPSPTLKVTVSGGLAPFPIKVKLLKAGVLQGEFENSTSFQHQFTNLVAGSYRLMISGTNPAGGSTKVEITKNDITLHPPDDSPITKSDHNYIVTFTFTVHPL